MCIDNHKKNEHYGISGKVIITVVITNFNRATFVLRAIRSVLTQPGFAHPHEIILVDDASDDNSTSLISAEFQDELEIGVLKLVKNKINLGVTGSKNRGFQCASGNWVIFLDSDDFLNINVWTPMSKSLKQSKANPIVFFRCSNLFGQFVGKSFASDVYLNLERYLTHTSYGEALTAVNKSLVKSEPYISELRGYEGLGCCRLINKHGAARLSTIVARCYDQTGADRLSMPKPFMRRMRLLSIGHGMLISEFGGSMTLRKKIGCRIKQALYYLAGTIYELF